MDKKKRTLLRSAVLGVTAIATSFTIGMSAACSTGGNSSSDNEDDKTTTKIDEQTIKNGNFEFYSDNKGLYPISNPDSWTKGSNGNSSASMSGVIGTGKERWDYITDPNLPQTLEDNDDLESGDEDKKDYNGALTDDLPYKNTHAATDTSSSSTDKDEHAKDYIDNPYTHKYSYNADGKVLDEEGHEVETFTDDDGNVFLDSEHKQPLETSVLMIHNYRSNDYYGAETYYTSSTTVSLEANTAAEISLWVKTTEMYFGSSNADREDARIEFERGAYIKRRSAATASTRSRLRISIPKSSIPSPRRAFGRTTAGFSTPFTWRQALLPPQPSILRSAWAKTRRTRLKAMRSSTTLP